MNKLLIVISCFFLVSTAHAKGWDYADYESIVGASHILLGTNSAEQRIASQTTDKEVVRLMTELGLSGGKFIAFSGENTNDPITERKKIVYEANRKSKYTQTNAHLQFANASHALNQQALNKVNALAQTYQIAKNEIKQITIKGHTNSIGSDKNNLLLSHNRAASVRSALLQQGIPSNLIRIHGFGETKPMTGTNPTAPINRRVEYAVVKK